MSASADTGVAGVRTISSCGRGCTLLDFYEFKENGLLKKTVTVTMASVQYHLVSYYSL